MKRPVAMLLIVASLNAFAGEEEIRAKSSEYGDKFTHHTIVADRKH